MSYWQLVSTYELLQASYNQLSLSYQSLNASYNQLNAMYQSLSENYSALQETYNGLLANYLALNASHSELLGQYLALNASYIALSNSYVKLYSALYDPLTNETILTIDELKAWLNEDSTDEIGYIWPNLVCGDFAVMLAFHAKLMGWDMGVVRIFAKKADGARFDQAFIAILCAEGLVYVEPQTDAVWWYENHSEITPGKWYNYPDVGQIYVEQYIVVLLYE